MKLTIVLPDGTRQPIEVSAQATLQRLLPALAAKIVLPRRDEAGTAVAYYATYQNEPIPDDQPLAALNIPDDALLVLHPVIVADPHQAIDLEPEAQPDPPLPHPSPIPRRRRRERPLPWRRRISLGCGLLVILSCCLGVASFSGVAYLIDRARAPQTLEPTATHQVIDYDSPEAVTLWDFAVIDAAYVPDRFQLIMISADPPRLHLYSVLSQRDTVLPLAEVPTAVAVSNDGYYAAISQQTNIVYANLLLGKVQSSYEGLAQTSALVLQADNWLYAFAPPDSLLASPLGPPNTTAITLPVAAPQHILRLAADGRSLYGTTHGAAFNRLEKIDITRGTPQFMYDSGTLADTCGAVWLAADGRFAFTGCGHIWRLADQRQNDMVLLGNFFATPQKIITLAHSATAERILLITEANDQEVAVYDSDGSNLLTTRNLPESTHGRFLFTNSQGTQYIIIIQTDEGQYGLVTGDI